MVTIPKEVADGENIGAGELIKIEVKKMRKSYFGAAKGIGRFTSEDEWKGDD